MSTARKKEMLGADAPRMSESEALFLERLRKAGLNEMRRCTFVRNLRAPFTWSTRYVRVHQSLSDAPDSVVEAMYYCVRLRSGVPRRDEAVRHLMEHVRAEPLSHEQWARRHGLPEGAEYGSLLLSLWHDDLNEKHFDGRLSPMVVRLSGRIRRRLGYYVIPSGMNGFEGEMVISLRLFEQGSQKAIRTTLLHEMVHQWQYESGLPVAHDREFRAKAREVGIPPSARIRT